MTDERALHEQVRELEAEVGHLRRLAQERERLINHIRADVMEFTMAQPVLPLRDMIRDIRRKVEDVQADKNARIDQLHNTVKLHAATIERKQKVIDDIQEEKRRQAKDIADLVKEREELHNRLAEAVLPSEENTILVTELSEVQEKVRLRNAQNASLRLELRRLRADIGTLQADIRSYSADGVRYRETISSLHREGSGLRTDIRRLQREVAEKVETIQGLMTDIRNLGGDEDHLPDHSDLEELDAHRRFVDHLDDARRGLRNQIGN